MCVAGWPGGLVARWLGGRVARWPGGRVAGWHVYKCIASVYKCSPVHALLNPLYHPASLTRGG